MLQLYRLKEQDPERVEYPSSSYSSASRIYQNYYSVQCYTRACIIRDSIIAWVFNVAIATSLRNMAVLLAVVFLIE